MTDLAQATFQDIIGALEDFWSDWGCLIWQPYNHQVGAGTMNPATFLRVLGPEPWNVAYVEPSVRPDDARYGENPNRMGTHYQYQVILKPDPGNPQELYLDSLAHLGIDLGKHDVRFVEDNWEQPALAAWGLGWEVWLDGLEITQFTYFQQAGGIVLEPPSVELTYGLDRIAMALQGVHHFGDIQWNRSHLYRELNLAAEQQNSAYYFEAADIDRLTSMYDLFELEAESSLGSGLFLPAYDYLLKCSHAFNVLDTRGAVGVTERAAYFGRMRRLARGIAEAYLDSLGEQPAEVAGAARPAQEPAAGPEQADTFLLEIGTEELPHVDLTEALAQAAQSARLFDDLRLEHGSVSVRGTPRRIIVEVDELAPRQSDLQARVKGPPVGRAFDDEGNPTPAAVGFARSAGVPVEALQRETMDGGEYVVAETSENGRTAAEVLSEALPEWMAGITFAKTMRWNSTGVQFSRPIRWLLALHGEHVVPFEYAGLRSDRRSRALRNSEPAEFTVGRPEDHRSGLEAGGILASIAERRAAVERAVHRLAAEVGGEPLGGDSLLDEVTDLVEAPVAMLGAFDESHLSLPSIVLIEVMRVHQRYFPIQKGGELQPHFVVVANGRSSDPGAVVAGNEAVLEARFADAAYFVRKDLERPLESYLNDLEQLVFQAELGSMRDKAERLNALARVVAADLGLPDDDIAIAERAALLAKADLATQMVVDMTSLQGRLGRHYAIESGESERVGIAIEEHYLPDPTAVVSGAGAAVAIADRLDTLMGLFAIGAEPSGTRDPFGLRRAAIGLVQLLAARGDSYDLRAGLDAAARQLPVEVSEEAIDRCLAFIRRRQEVLLLETGWPHDVVQAVLAEQSHDPSVAAGQVAELAAQIEKPDWEQVLNAYSRSARITSHLADRLPYSEEALVEPAERELASAVPLDSGANGSVDAFAQLMRGLVPVIDRFFDEVLVMDEDETVRINRLALLQRVTALADGVADLSRLEGF